MVASICVRAYVAAAINPIYCLVTFGYFYEDNRCKLRIELTENRNYGQQFGHPTSLYKVVTMTSRK